MFAYIIYYFTNTYDNRLNYVIFYVSLTCLLYFLIIYLSFISKTFGFLQIFSLPYKNYLDELFPLERDLGGCSKTHFRKCIWTSMTDGSFRLPGPQHLIKLLSLKQMSNHVFSYKSRGGKLVRAACAGHHDRLSGQWEYQAEVRNRQFGKSRFKNQFKGFIYYV